MSPGARSCLLGPVAALECQCEGTHHPPSASSAPAKPSPAGLEGEERDVAAAMVPILGGLAPWYPHSCRGAKLRLKHPRGPKAEQPVTAH